MEVIGVVAALAQLAKYSIDICNGVSEASRRMRHAPALLRQWSDHASLLASLADPLSRYPDNLPNLPVDIIDRLTEEASKVSALLQELAILNGGTRISNIMKRLTIVRKEKEISGLLTSLGQRTNALQALLLIYSINNQGKQQISAKQLAVGPLPRACVVAPMICSGQALTTNVRRCHRNFVGQKTLLQTLLQRLDMLRGSRIVISGLSGIGKTELAAEFARLLRQRMRDLSVFWIDGSSKASLASSFEAACRFSNATVNTSCMPELIHSTLSCVDSEARGSYLIVFDNVDISTIAPEALRTVLPRSCKGHILFTTRNQHFALRLVHPTQVVEMHHMCLEDAGNLLLTFVGPGLGSTEEAAPVAKHLDCFPLAIVQAGIYLRSTSTRLQEFLRILELARASLLMSHPTKTLAFLLSDSSMVSLLDNALPIPPNEDYTQWVLHVLFVLSCLEPTGIPSQIISALQSSIEPREAITLLKAYYIIQPGPNGTSWQLNPFVRFLAKERLVTSALRIDIFQMALQMVATHCPLQRSDRLLSDTPQAYVHPLSTINIIMELSSAHEIASSNLSIMITLGASVCQHLATLGRVREAVFLIANLVTWTRPVSNSHAEALNILHSKYGAVHCSTGQLRVAKRITWEVLHSQVRITGYDHLDTLHSLNNLGIIYCDQGKLQKAEHCHRKALEAKERLFGPQHLDTLVSCSNLAVSLQKQGKRKDAEALFCRVLCGRRRLLPNTDYHVLVTMNNLGLCYQLQNRLDEAEQMHKATIKGLERMFNYAHPELLKCQGNLALVLDRQGRCEEATQLLYQVSQEQKDMQGNAHPDTIKMLRNLAILLHRQSKLSEAHAAVTDALAAQEEKHGKGHPETFPDLQFLSIILHLQHKYDEALDIVAWLFESRSELLGSDHPDTQCSRDHVIELEEDIRLKRVDSAVSISTIVS